MALFGSPGTEKILEKGSRTPGRIVGIDVRYVSDRNDSTIRRDEYAVELVGGEVIGIRQVLIPDDRVRLGMPVEVVVLDRAGVIDWAAVGIAGGFASSTTTERHKALRAAPPAGIVDRADDIDAMRKKGEAAVLSITALDDRPVLGGLTTRLAATVTVTLSGVEPFEAEVKNVKVPHYASHLVAVGRSVPGFVKLRRLDKPVFDWPAAAMAEPGIGEPPAIVSASPERPKMMGIGTVVDAEAQIASAGSSDALPAGIDMDLVIAIELGLQHDRVPPADYDRYAHDKGLAPHISYAEMTKLWQQAMKQDWRLGSAYGERFEAARKRR